MHACIRHRIDGMTATNRAASFFFHGTTFNLIIIIMPKGEEEEGVDDGQRGEGEPNKSIHQPIIVQ